VRGNNGLVDYEKLHERLLATGKSFAGEAVLMIEHMEKIWQNRADRTISCV